jgi:hypothetical protein
VRRYGGAAVRNKKYIYFFIFFYLNISCAVPRRVLGTAALHFIRADIYLNKKFI